MVATGSNMGGLGLGALLAGILAQFAPLPLRLTFWVDLGLVLLAILAVWAVPETVAVPARPRLRIRPPSVPPSVRPAFLRAAIAGFAGFAVLGLFTAVAPAFLGQELGVTSPAVIGLVVFAVFAASMVGQVMLQLVAEALAMPAGCLALITGMGSLALGVALSSLALLVLGGVIAGFGHGLAFRAGLTAVTARAPAEQRGDVASSFFVVMYVAISLPVIGVGVLAQTTGLRTAGLIFAAAVAAVAVAVLVLLGRERAIGGLALADAGSRSPR
jgi:hypothetical protein